MVIGDTIRRNSTNNMTWGGGGGGGRLGVFLHLVIIINFKNWQFPTDPLIVEMRNMIALIQEALPCTCKVMNE